MPLDVGVLVGFAGSGERTVIDECLNDWNIDVACPADGETVAALHRRPVGTTYEATM